MPVYEYRCECGQELSTVRSMTAETLHKVCPECDGIAERRWTSFGVQLSMPEHYNWSLGRFVSNRHDLVDGFKKSSEHASEMTGMEHRYVPCHPSELALE